MRKEQKLAQLALANKCSVNREQISRIENARRDYMHSTLLEVCEGGGATTLVFPGITGSRYAGNRFSDGVNEGDNDGVSAVVNDDLNEGVTKGIKSELDRVLKVIVNKPGVNASEIADRIGKSIATTERYISLLRQLGTIERKGAARTSGYYPSNRTDQKLEKLMKKKS